jgi:hypothetical protein
MKFETGEGKAKTISIQPCKPNLTAGEVESAMDAFISSDIFAWNPTDKLGASIVERKTTTLL